MENIELFNGIKDIGLDELLGYLQAKPQVFKKGQIILKKGDKLSNIMIVLVGEVKIKKDCPDGADFDFGVVSDGGTICPELICSETSVSPVDVIAQKQTGVLFMPYKKIVNYNEKIAVYQAKLISNLFKIVAKKNVINTKRLFLLEKKSIREKVLTLLKLEAASVGKKEFELPFSREEMAGYLCVDRSALSRELSNLQKEKIIEYDRNWFKLIK